MRKVKFKVYAISSYYGKQISTGEIDQGYFHNFADDSKMAIVETRHGEIIRIPVEDITFIHQPGEES